MEHLVELREYCRKKKWPRLPQWLHWIYSQKPVAQACVKKIGGRYLIDLDAFQNYIKSATLVEETKPNNSKKTLSKKSLKSS